MFGIYICVFEGPVLGSRLSQLCVLPGDGFGPLPVCSSKPAFPTNKLLCFGVWSQREVGTM